MSRLPATRRKASCFLPRAPSQMNLAAKPRPYDSSDEEDDKDDKDDKEKGEEEKDSIEDDTEGEAAPYFRSSYTTQPTQILGRTNQILGRTTSTTTQPTQILGRTTQPTQVLARNPNQQKPRLPPWSTPAIVANADNSSPPPRFSTPIVSSPSSRHADLVEVPASSPVQSAGSPAATSSKPSLGSRLAPAGTQFRPPPRRPEQAIMLKRPAPEPIVLSSDSESDLSPRRGDIVPTAFANKISSFAYNNNNNNNNNAGRPSKKTPNAFDTLMRVGDDVSSGPKKKKKRKEEDDEENSGTVYQAVSPPRRSGQNPPRPSSSPVLSRPLSSVLPKKRRLVQGLASRSRPIPSSGLLLEAKQKAKTSKKLMRGLPPRDAPVSSQWQEPQPPPPPSLSSPSSADPILLSSDNEDDYRDLGGNQGEEGGGSFNEQVLKCLNASSLEDLAAMTKIDKTALKTMIDKRPFRTLSHARNVTTTKKKKSSSTKSQKVQLGDNVVDNVVDYLHATNAIDEIVADCDAKARQVKQEMGSWDMDLFGKQQRDEVVQMLTPDSTNHQQQQQQHHANHQKSLPIPCQPRLMDGHCEMKSFQLFGLNWMHLLYKNAFGSILADEMGLGKTCQVISLMCQLVQEGERNGTRPWPNLIVVPPSTYENWLAEFERFAPDLQVVGYQGSQTMRLEIAEEILEAPEDYHVVLTTYTQVVSESDIEAMRDLKPNVAVFDEGHKIKNPKTKTYRELIRIPAQWRMLLTGTPIQNNLLEMIALLSFINPKMFRGHMEHIEFMFSQKITARDVTNGAFLYSERVKRARTILEPFILQRQKHQVTEMAKKTRTVVHCDLTGAQRSHYDKLEGMFRSDKPRVRPAEGRQNDQNNIWVQLRKAALHPQLFRLAYKDDRLAKMAKILMAEVPQSELQQPSLRYLTEELKNSSDFEIGLWCRDYSCIADFALEPGLLANGSGKVLKLLELIRQYEANGDRVLVFSKFSRMIEILHEVLSVLGVKHCKLSGQTDVSERQDLIDEFNGDDTIPVFLLTTAAGGTGINLAAANKVVIFDQSDNPQDDIQAENRAHRLGQRREVEIIRLLARNTVEELIYKVCEKKIELANKVTGAEEDLTGAGDGVGGKKLEEEVRRMMTTKQPTPS